MRRWYKGENVASDDPAVRSSVLLVDDNADNLLALSAVLDRLKLRLVQATSGARALALAAEEEFAVIILDVQMPVLDGFETARLLRMRPAGDQTPIIFLTANSHDPATSLRGYAEGAVDFLVKPFDPGILRSKVSVFVSLQEARRTVQRQEALLREHALEAQRRESDARYQSLAEAVPLIVWTADVSGKITYANRAWTEYTGISPHQLTSWKHIVHPDNHAAVKAARDRARSKEAVFQALFRVRSASGPIAGTWGKPSRAATPGATGRLAGDGDDVDDQRRSEERARFLAEASGVLGASLDLREVLARVCALSVPAAGDVCAVHLRREDGFSREVAVAPDLVERLASPGPEQLERLGIAEVLESGRSVVERRADGRETPLGLSRWVSVPLVSRGAVIGVLTLGRRAEVETGLLSEGMAVELARRVAVAADNASLYEEAQEAIRLLCLLVEPGVVRRERHPPRQLHRHLLETEPAGTRPVARPRVCAPIAAPRLTAGAETHRVDPRAASSARAPASPPPSVPNTLPGATPRRSSCSGPGKAGELHQVLRRRRLARESVLPLEVEPRRRLRLRGRPASRARASTSRRCQATPRAHCWPRPGTGRAPRCGAGRPRPLPCPATPPCVPARRGWGWLSPRATGMPRWRSAPKDAWNTAG